MIVFSRRNMRNVSTFRFLFYLAVFDLLVLATGTTHLLIKQLYGFDLRIHSNIVCKLHTFFTYVTTHVSSLILMTVSIDRTLKIKTLSKLKPNKLNERQKSFSNAKSSKIFIHLNEKDKFDHLDIEFDSLNDKKPKRANTKVRFSIRNDSIKMLKKNRAKSGDLKESSGYMTEYFRFSRFSSIEDEALYERHFLKLICKYGSVDAVVMLIILFILVLNGHYIFFLKLDSQKISEFNFLSDLILENIFESEDSYILITKCQAETDSIYEKFLQDHWFWIDMSVYSIVPFVIMSICSLIIAFKFNQINRNYFELVSNKSHGLNKNNFLRKIKKNRQICFMLFNSNFYFFIIMLQYWICFFSFKNNNGKDELLNELQSFVYIFLYTNNAFEFLIFSITSEKYRNEFYSIFFKLK